MRNFSMIAQIVFVVMQVFWASADAGDHRRDGGRQHRYGGEFKEEFRDGPCTVKIESKRAEFLREIKCPDGYGAPWRGEWKREFRDGHCWVKQDVKRDEFKEEVKCGSSI